MTLSLRIAQSLYLGGGQVIDVTPDVQGYRRSIRGRGGYWMGDFTLTGSDKDLGNLFYEYLGGHFEEKSNGAFTWEGMIYEMDITFSPPSVGGFQVTRRRTLDKLYNYIGGRYTDLAGVQTELTVAQNPDSIKRYGRREDYLLLNNMKIAAAEAMRDVYLREYGWPIPRVTDISYGQGQGQAVLKVALVGYVGTINWKYRTAGDGTDGNVSDFIKALIEADCGPILVPGKITPNTLQVPRGANNPIRAGDLVFSLADLGDAGHNPWWIYCTQGGKMIYEPIPTEPRYYLHSGNIYETAGGVTQVDPWRVQPGVFRDMTYPVRATGTDTWLTDARDFYVSEVEVGTGNGLVLKTDEFEDTDLMTAQAEYDAQMRGGQDLPGKKAKRGFDWWVRYAQITKKDDITAKYEWSHMPLAQRSRWKKTVWLPWKRKRDREQG